MKSNEQLYAMKEMEKARVLQRQSVSQILDERLLLSQLRHPLLVNMEYAFQDHEQVYLVCDLMPGGDLRYHIGNLQYRYSHDETKFLIACLVSALQYVHSKNVIHRDVKPENLVFDDKGYLRLTDFGIAQKRERKNQHDCSGTPSYMAPEVVFR